MDQIDVYKAANYALAKCNATIDIEGYPNGIAEHWMRSAMQEVAKFLNNCIERYDSLGDEQWFREIVDIIDAQQAHETRAELDALDKMRVLDDEALSKAFYGAKIMHTGRTSVGEDRIDAATYAIAAAAEERKQLIYKLYAALLTSTKGETPEYLASRAVLAADTIIKKI